MQMVRDKAELDAALERIQHRSVSYVGGCGYPAYVFGVGDHAAILPAKYVVWELLPDEVVRMRPETATYAANMFVDWAKELIVKFVTNAVQTQIMIKEEDRRRAFSLKGPYTITEYRREPADEDRRVAERGPERTQHGDGPGGRPDPDDLLQP